MSWNGWGWRPYVPVAERRARADKAIRKMEKKGRAFSPVMIEGRQIAQTFWGKGWCDHLESHEIFGIELDQAHASVPATVVSIAPSRKTKTKTLKTARPQRPRPKRRRKARAVRDIKST